MRLIDADVLKQHIDKLPALPDGNFAGNHSALKALINMQPTFEPSTNCSEVPNSSDAISRQAAIEALAEQIALCDKALNSFGISMKDEYAVKVEKASLVAYKEQLEVMPATDVAPVVRCGQCKYWQDNDSDYDYGYCYAKDGHGFGHAWGKNDFCSYGERREE